MLIAISTNSDSQQVERFGHDFPVLLLDVEAETVQSTRQLEPQSGCCKTLAKRLDGAAVLLCTGVGQGAARHLSDLGVAVAVVPEGVTVQAAMESFLTQTLKTGEFATTECDGHGGDHCGCGDKKSSAD